MSWRDEVIELQCGKWDFGGQESENARRFAEEQWYRHDEQWRKVAPRRFVDASPEDFTEEFVEAFEDWRQDWSRNLLILGPVGTGKSHVGFAVVHHLWMMGVPAKWASMVDLLNDLRPDGDGSLHSYLKPAVLFIDDLGTQKPSEWVSEQTYGIIDARWRDKKPIIATSNLSPQALKDSLGERAWSRLQDDAVAVTLTGRDRRRAA